MNRRIILLVIFGIMLCGCRPIVMRPDYAKQVELAAIDVAELNRRCQGGDDLACRSGLAAASQTLELIVDAMHGRAGEDPNDGR